MTISDMLRPRAVQRARAYDVVLILCGSLLVTLSAQVAIPLPLSPVPISGQTLAVLLLGALLGSRRGSLSVLAYLGQGAAGLPVFAGGQMGLAHLLGPRGGYLVGFVAAAWVTGRLAERGWDRRLGSTLLAMLLGNLAIYACGLPWLALFAGRQALAWGLYPFVVGDLLKLALATALLPTGWRLLGQGETPCNPGEESA
jgi:biotin transport system substrate-specific component